MAGVPVDAHVQLLQIDFLTTEVQRPTALRHLTRFKAEHAGIELDRCLRSQHNQYTMIDCADLKRSLHLGVSVDVLRHPPIQELRDGEIVQLKHHHVRVAPDAPIGKAHEVDLDPGL